MNSAQQKRLTVVLSISGAVLALLAVWGWARDTMSHVEATLADGRTETLLEARDAALQTTNVMEVADTLRWLGRYYRPMQPPTSGIALHHYNLMERIRESYERELVLHLRRLTEDQLGNDPRLWVDKYAKPEK